MAYVTLSSKAIGSTVKLKVNGSAKDFMKGVTEYE